MANKLPVAALIGWDVPDLMTLFKPKNAAPALIADVSQTSSTDPGSTAHDAPQPQDRQVTSAPSPSHTEQQLDDTELPFRALDESLFSSTRPQKKYLTRSQKRENNRSRSTPASDPPTTEVEQPLGISAAEFQKLQETDHTLMHTRQVAGGQRSTIAGSGFFFRNGLLYRNYQPPGNTTIDDATEQLVLPVQCRKPVLHLAHSIPLAGHLGRRKTASRILQRFYWPGIFCDVYEYCRSCTECQKSSPKGKTKAQLVPLPVIDVPFKRIAMDIVGPLPRTTSGKRYILVICHYATRYPEAIPIRSFSQPYCQ